LNCRTIYSARIVFAAACAASRAMVSPCRPSSCSWRNVSLRPVVWTVRNVVMLQKLHPYPRYHRRGALGVDFGYAPAAAVGGKFVARLWAVFHVAEFSPAALFCR